ncbi:Stromal membrane-associated protein [Paragonimus heterotremus]|uniref:Stromal membrane-associated protein n=1 Tax=Paragonimus heterotremus TaxID=100268 RepID=A0A8J4SZ77_9TREM|nr:Stromal membrane-associated protein [Paragonimus heterotremus]
MTDYRLELVKLVREPNNSFCADCGEPRPLWASWNLGVFLCLRCAAIHRKLGTHVSKVKSLQLDSWTSDQFQTLSQSSNLQSRRIFEATLPESFIRPEKEAALEAFIRAKYERKAFVKSCSDKNIQAPAAESNQKIGSILPPNLIDFENMIDEHFVQAPPPFPVEEHNSITLHEPPVRVSAPSVTPAVRPPNFGTPTDFQSQYLHKITQQLAAIRAEKLPSATPFS